MDYLGHIVGQYGVKVDLKKIQAMQEWPHTETLKVICRFLGLIGYYWKFMKNYGKIVGPLKNILNKNTFPWNEVEEKAFTNIK